MFLYKLQVKENSNENAHNYKKKNHKKVMKIKVLLTIMYTCYLLST